MGTTAENVQVRSAQTRVAEAARRFLLSSGFEEVFREAEADRTLIVGPAEPGGWSAVYDSEFGSSEALAKALSSNAGSPAISLMVHDSDDVFVNLFEQGKTKDRFERSEGKRKRKGDPAKWAGLAEVDAVKAAFEGDPVFAEDSLMKLATALGIPPERCVTTLEEAEGDDLIHLYFKAKGTDGWKPRPAVGLPTLEGPGHGNHPLTAGEGEILPAGALTAYVHNAGGPLRGVRIEIGGEAVDDGILNLTTIEVFIPTTKFMQRFELGPGERSVTLPELELRAGMTKPGPGIGLGTLLGLVRRKPMDLSHTVTARIGGAAVRSGVGRVTVTFIPLENPERGKATEIREIVVRAMDRVPLKARGATSGRSTMFQILSTRRAINAVISLDGAYAGPARQAIETWAAFIARTRPERWELMLMPARMQMPKEYKSKGSDVSSDKRWKTWLSDLESIESLSGIVGERTALGNYLNAGCAGFGFDKSSMFTMFNPLPLAPQLGFWLDTKIFHDDELAEAEALLASLIDGLMNNGYGLQGFLAHWGCGNLTSLAVTLYEQACGVQGQCTTLRTWCSRYLRGVGDRVWLGPELAARLGRSGVVSLIADQGLDELERELEPVLAGDEEWRKGMQVLYHRASWE